MNATLFYYTGTGNSLWVARRLAIELGKSSLYSIPQMKQNPLHVQTEKVGLIFPVHMWGVPSPVLSFLQRLVPDPDQFYFAVAVNAGQVSRTLIQLQEAMAVKGMSLSAGFEVVLPTNYLPWGGPGPAAEMNRRFIQAEEKIRRMTPYIQQQIIRHAERGPWLHRLLFTPVYKMAFPHVPHMDRAFWVDEKCNQCGICAQVCPARNIRIPDGRPVWSRTCEQCMACIQWCPQTAIQYGKKTLQYPRYHHPEVILKDIIESNQQSAGE
ncbi:MAG: EFR1 family ferrodoxin [candidate division FCPU426 bacterium]